MYILNGFFRYNKMPELKVQQLNIFFYNNAQNKYKTFLHKNQISLESNIFTQHNRFRTFKKY